MNTEKTILNCFEIINYAMDLHYDKWDIEGREESDIPQRIGRYKYFTLKRMPLSLIGVSDFEIDDNKIEDYLYLNEETIPPIVLEQKRKGKHYIIDGSHRYFIALKKNMEFIEAYVPTRILNK